MILRGGRIPGGRDTHETGIPKRDGPIGNGLQLLRYPDAIGILVGRRIHGTPIPAAQSLRARPIPESVERNEPMAGQTRNADPRNGHTM
jgi:hypothetical protein